MDTTKLTKILFFALIISGIMMVILPEYRSYIIYLIIIMGVGWIFYTKPNWNDVREENKKAIKFFIIPSAILCLILIFVYPEFNIAGIVYLFFICFALVMYMTPELQDSIIGLHDKPSTGVLIGLGIPVLFIVLSKYNIAFSFLTPSLPASIATQMRAVILIGLAPIAEEIIFRGAVFGGLQSKYKLGWIEANVIQSIIFSATHILAYGVLLSTFDKWIEVFGAVNAMAGAFVAAIAFGLLAGTIVHKTKNLLPGILAHAIINGYLIINALIIIS